MSLCEKMEVQRIGAFLRDYPMEHASHIELDLLYLKDFVSGVLLSHNTEEAKVCVLFNIVHFLYRVGSSDVFFGCTQVLEATLVFLSDQMLQSTDKVTLLHRLVSYHVAYHLNEVHFAQYRALGDIFQDLHGLVKDQLSLQNQTTSPVPPSSFREEVCIVEDIAVIILIWNMSNVCNMASMWAKSNFYISLLFPPNHV